MLGPLSVPDSEMSENGKQSFCHIPPLGALPFLLILPPLSSNKNILLIFFSSLKHKIFLDNSREKLFFNKTPNCVIIFQSNDQLRQLIKGIII